jgi:sialic acid synthase SpsE
MACIRDYPADIANYTKRFTFREMVYVSDHTVGWELYRMANPRILEKHLCPDREADNPDSGPFAVIPEELYDVIV